MSDKLMFTRRRFLQTGLALASAATSVPAFVQRAAAATQNESGGALTSRPGVPQDRILLIVELSGGNDGLNTIIPHGHPAYYDARPQIGIREKDVIAWDTRHGIGLHPEMRDFKTMVDQGLAAVVQGVGYPNPNRSHFSSMDIWHTGDPNGGKGLGWVGRSLDHHRQMRQGTIDPTACVCIGQETPLAAQGRHVKPIAFEEAALFRWVGADLHPVLDQAYQQLGRSAPGVIDPSSQKAFLMRTSLDAQIASDKIRTAVAKGPVTSFPGSTLGRQLQMVAAMIRAEMPTRVYYVGMGGFDTHANQPYAHGRNLRDFSAAMLAFYRELQAIDQQDRVIAMAFSEFGRRVKQNASNGTDHGTAAPVYLFGSSVRPGLLGTHPSLTELDRDDLIYNVDFRSVYAAILENWMKIDSRQVLGRSFKLPQILRAT